MLSVQKPSKNPHVLRAMSISVSRSSFDSISRWGGSSSAQISSGIPIHSTARQAENSGVLPIIAPAAMTMPTAGLKYSAP